MDLYIDCSYGISGDMLVGALLDLGADEEYLKRMLNSLNLSFYDIKINKINKKGVLCTDFDVILDNPTNDHNMQYLYGKERVNLNFGDSRNLSQITQIINNSKITNKAKALSLKIFNIIATAEADAHKVNKEDVQFHEKGAMDSIIDIVSIAVCIDNLKVNKIYADNLVEGKGYINTRVGKLTIPTPAVKNMIKMFNLDVGVCDFNYELITPTGLASLCAMCEFLRPQINKIIKVGYGAGKRNYDTPCVLLTKLIN